MGCQINSFATGYDLVLRSENLHKITVMGARLTGLPCYHKTAVSLAIKDMKLGQQFTNRVLESPSVEQTDYAFAVVLNKAGLALVFESPRPYSSGVYWQVLHHQLPDDSDPFTAVQNNLVQKTGYQTSHWSYLGNHVLALGQPASIGYYFCARQAHQVTAPQPNGHCPNVPKWIPLTDLRYALLDGRIAIASHALTVSLTLLTLSK